MADLPFWSDDFDMDLPKVIPEARALLGELADLELVTTSHTTHGRINCPCCWNHELGLVSFFGRPGKLYREPGYVTSNAEVKCTLWEAIRDSWSHNNVIVFEFDPVFDGGALWPHFERIMYHIRGSDVRPDAEIAEHKVRALQAIGQCAMLVRRRIEVVDHEPSPSADPSDEEQCTDCLAHPAGVCNEHVIHEPPF